MYRLPVQVVFFCLVSLFHIAQQQPSVGSNRSQELRQLNNKLYELQVSEDGRSARELRAIDLDIKQAKTKVGVTSYNFIHLASPF